MADEFPIAFSAFAKKLRGTESEIYTKLINILHGTEKHSHSEWKALLETIRNPTPAKAPAVADALIPTASEG